MSRFDRPDPPSDGLDMRGPEAPKWHCKECHQRFTLGPAKTHHEATGHTIFFKQTPIYQRVTTAELVAEGRA